MLVSGTFGKENRDGISGDNTEVARPGRGKWNNYTKKSSCPCMVGAIETISRNISASKNTLYISDTTTSAQGKYCAFKLKLEALLSYLNTFNGDQIKKI